MSEEKNVTPDTKENNEGVYMVQVVSNGARGEHDLTKLKETRTFYFSSYDHAKAFYDFKSQDPDLLGEPCQESDTLPYGKWEYQEPQLIEIDMPFAIEHTTKTPGLSENEIVLSKALKENGISESKINELPDLSYIKRLSAIQMEILTEAIEVMGEKALELIRGERSPYIMESILNGEKRGINMDWALKYTQPSEFRYKMLDAYEIDRIVNNKDILNESMYDLVTQERDIIVKLGVWESDIYNIIHDFPYVDQDQMAQDIKEHIAGKKGRPIDIIDRISGELNVAVISVEDYLDQQYSDQNSDKLEDKAKAIANILASKGYSYEKLADMEPDEIGKIIDKSLEKEIEEMSKDTDEER